MRVCFVVVGEANSKFINMMELLLYSFRKNAGIFKDAPFYIVTNGVSLSPSKILDLQTKFSPVYSKAMPRLGGTPHTNKFNALYAIDENSYDVLIFLDCDIVILSELNEITNNIKIDKPFFSAIPAGKAAAFSGYQTLIQKYCQIEKNVSSLKDAAFVTEYPLFNSGVLVMNKQAVTMIRNDSIIITYELFNKYNPNNIIEHLRFFVYKIILKVNKIRNQRLNIFKKLITIFLSPLGIDFPLFLSEQVGLSLAVLKHNIQYSVLNSNFNYNQSKLLSNGKLPSVFHYMNGIYPIDREHLFEGDWIEEYINSESPVKQSLAKLAVSYINE